MNNPKFATNEFYHIYNRGTEKIDIAVDHRDHVWFMQCLYDFNDISPPIRFNNRIRFVKVEPLQKREKLVNIHAFCLMPNHYHMLLEQVRSGGVTLFMRKLGTGYTMYFNQKYERSGVLFQGRYKAKHIHSDSYLQYIPHYIHMNPLDLTIPDWRKKTVDYSDTITILDKYPWSSWHAYNNRKSFERIMDTKFFNEVYGGKEKYINNLKTWLKNMNLDSMNKDLFHF